MDVDLILTNRLEQNFFGPLHWRARQQPSKAAGNPFNCCSKHQFSIVKAPVFLELGEKYQIEELKMVAEKEMLVQLDKINMVNFLSIGDLFNAGNLREASLNLTRANLGWLRSQKSRMEELKQLNKDLVLELL